MAVSVAYAKQLEAKEGRIALAGKWVTLARVTERGLESVEVPADQLDLYLERGFVDPAVPVEEAVEEVVEDA